MVSKLIETKSADSTRNLFDHKTNPWLRASSLSSAIVALLLYLCLNLILIRSSHFSLHIPFKDYPKKNEIWHVMQKCDCLADKPEVFF